MKLIKYLKKVMIDPCKGCLVDSMCSRVCERLIVYHDTRENIIANIIVVFMISIVVAFIVAIIHMLLH